MAPKYSSNTRKAQQEQQSKPRKSEKSTEQESSVTSTTPSPAPVAVKSKKSTGGTVANSRLARGDALWKVSLETVHIATYIFDQGIEILPLAWANPHVASHDPDFQRVSHLLAPIKIPSNAEKIMNGEEDISANLDESYKYFKQIIQQYKDHGLNEIFKSIQSNAKRLENDTSVIASEEEWRSRVWDFLWLYITQHWDFATIRKPNDQEGNNLSNSLQWRFMQEHAVNFSRFDKYDELKNFQGTEANPPSATFFERYHQQLENSRDYQDPDDQPFLEDEDTDSKKQDSDNQNVQPGAMFFAIVMSEYKKRSEKLKNLRTAQNQCLTYGSNATRFLKTIGCVDFPVLLLATDGPTATFNAAWYSSVHERQRVLMSMHKNNSFNIATVTGFFQFLGVAEKIKEQMTTFQGTWQKLRTKILKGTKSGSIPELWTAEAQIQQYSIERKSKGKANTEGQEE
ncbi:hypothetical protein OH77DRAFT_1440387 [Trametes cingulata]|nr:hypothetical protein OH77DRAFT_1440387 [Trametes cingulata]